MKPKQRIWLTIGLNTETKFVFLIGLAKTEAEANKLGKQRRDCCVDEFGTRPTCWRAFSLDDTTGDHINRWLHQRGYGPEVRANVIRQVGQRLLELQENRG